MDRLSLLFGCVSTNRRATPARIHRLRFSVSVDQAFAGGFVPEQLVELMVYLCREGICVTNLWRRQGNLHDVRYITKTLCAGRMINMKEFSYFTLASVVKKFLLKLRGGLLSAATEVQLLATLSLCDDEERVDYIHEEIAALSLPAQQLLTLLIGTWSQLSTQSLRNSMDSHSIARSVCGSLFHTCNDNPERIERAVRLLQFLIDNFTLPRLFGAQNIRNFCSVTKVRLVLRDTIVPVDYARRPVVQSTPTTPAVPHPVRGESVKKSKSAWVSEDWDPILWDPDFTASSADLGEDCCQSLERRIYTTRQHYATASLQRFNCVRSQQIKRMRLRSQWFVSGSQPSVFSTDSLFGDNDWETSRCLTPASEPAHMRTPSPQTRDSCYDSALLENDSAVSFSRDSSEQPPSVELVKPYTESSSLHVLVHSDMISNMSLSEYAAFLVEDILNSAVALAQHH